MMTRTLLRPALIAVVLTLVSVSAKEAETGNPDRGEGNTGRCGLGLASNLRAGWAPDMSYCRRRPADLVPQVFRTFRQLSA
jgi:hypothetical protein